MIKKLIFIYLIYIFISDIAESFAKEIKALNTSKVEEHTVLSLLSEVGFSKGVINTMLCIAKRESNLKIKAVNHYNYNGTKDYGLMQINSIWLEACNLSKNRWKSPLENIKCAKKIYDKQGLKAWASYKHCKLSERS